MWGSFWHGKLVKVYCDNEAMVHVLSTGHTWDDLLGAFARSTWVHTASRDIELQYLQIASIKKLLSDALSCYFSQGLSST